MSEKSVSETPVLEHLVALPLGTAAVKLDRRGLSLGERGGFEARWVAGAGAALALEDFRKLVKAHLQEVYRQQEGSEPSNVTLNLASHQFVDDLVGWSKLNASSRPSS